MVLREKPQNQVSTSALPCVVIFTKKSEVIPGSMRTFGYKGSAEINGKWQFRKNVISLENSSPDSKAGCKFYVGMIYYTFDI